MTELDYVIAYKKILKEEVIQMKVVSDSMFPLIKVNDLIVVKKVEHQKLEMFDIVVVWDGRRWLSHFVWYVDLHSDMIVTRSLKNPTSNDFPVRKQDVLGRVANFKLSFFQKFKVALKNRFAKSA